MHSEVTRETCLKKIFAKTYFDLDAFKHVRFGASFLGA